MTLTADYASLSAWPLPRTPSMRLDGRRALITGAGRGLGFAAAAALAEAGAHVTLVARTMVEIEARAAAIRDAGGMADAGQLDMTDNEGVTRMVETAEPFDILVNNAGTNRPAATVDVTPSDFDTVFALNVRSAFFVVQAVARRLIGAGHGGSIINMSSQMGHVGATNRSVYCATKHAVEGMTKAMAVEFGPFGIRVNTICPTFIITPMTERFFANQAFRSEVMAKIKTGRLGCVEDIMGAVVFLASDASALMTGSALMLDGGWTAD